MEEGDRIEEEGEEERCVYEAYGWLRRCGMWWRMRGGMGRSALVMVTARLFGASERSWGDWYRGCESWWVDSSGVEGSYPKPQPVLPVCSTDILAVAEGLTTLLRLEVCTECCSCQPPEREKKDMHNDS